MSIHPAPPPEIKRVTVGARARRKRSTALLAVSAVAAGLVWLSQTSWAYYLEGPRWPAGTTVVLRLSLGSAFRTLKDGNTSWNTAVSPALGMWNVVMQRLRFSGVMNSTAPVASGDHVNSVVFSNTIFGQSFGSNTLAVTYYRYYGSTMLEADILFNRAQKFDSYRGALQYGIYDIRRVMLHELGHVLGLAHPDQHGQHVVAIMNSVISNLYTLAPDDIAGAQYLYGKPL